MLFLFKSTPKTKKRKHSEHFLHHQEPIGSQRADRTYCTYILSLCGWIYISLQKTRISIPKVVLIFFPQGRRSNRRTTTISLLFNHCPQCLIHPKATLDTCQQTLLPSSQPLLHGKKCLSYCLLSQCLSQSSLFCLLFALL